MLLFKLKKKLHVRFEFEDQWLSVQHEAIVADETGETDFPNFVQLFCKTQNEL